MEIKRVMVEKKKRRKEVQRKRILWTLWVGGWWSADGGGRMQSSLSEDIYILQSAPWIRIVEFPLIKEEGNVFTIKPDAQNEWLGEAWACRSTLISASPCLPLWWNNSEGGEAQGWKYISFVTVISSFNEQKTLIFPHIRILLHCAVVWPLDGSVSDFYCILCIAQRPQIALALMGFPKEDPFVWVGGSTPDIWCIERHSQSLCLSYMSLAAEKLHCSNH